MSDKSKRPDGAPEKPPARRGHTAAGLGPGPEPGQSADAARAADEVTGPSPVVTLPTIGRFGPYEIVGRLAMGGMAEILLARETLEGAGSRYVVVKRILPQYSDDQEFINMFLDEARIVMRISHPNVCHIYNFGKEQASYFIAMEWVNGAPLGKVIRRARDAGGVPMPIACKIAAEVAEALDSAHNLVSEDGEPLNLIHRDVTPHNVMITYDGKVKLIDFGIAKAAMRSHQTSAGVVKGKFAYMPPEQIEGKDIDHRVDLFALTICLYETLVGKSLYARKDDIATLRAVVHEPVPRLGDRMEAPAALEAIIARGLAKKPEDRFETAREMQEALDQFIASRREVVSARRISDLMQQLFSAELKLGPTVDTAPFGSSFHTGGPDVAAVMGAPRMARDSAPPDTYSELDLPKPGRRAQGVADTLPGTAGAEDEDDQPTRLVPQAAQPVDPGPVLDLSPPAARPSHTQPDGSPAPRPPAVAPPGYRPEMGAAMDLGLPEDARTDHLVLDYGPDAADAPPRRAPVRPGAARAAQVRTAAAAPRSGGGTLKWIALVVVLAGLAAVAVVLGHALLQGGEDDTRPVTDPAGPVLPELIAVSIIVTPAGAEVTFGDESLGPAPVERRVVEPGSHRVRVELEGYEPHETWVAVEPGDEPIVDVVLTLPEGTEIGRDGRLTLETDPAARLWIAGKWIGETPLENARVPSGVQDVVLEVEGGERFRRRVFVRTDGETSSYLDLREEAANRDTTGR